MQHDPVASLLDIQLAGDLARELCGHVTREEFLADAKTQWAVYSQFIIIGEAANRIPRDWQLTQQQIPWQKLTGMRNRLVHGYDQVRWEIVWNTLQDDLSTLLNLIDDLLKVLRSPEP